MTYTIKLNEEELTSLERLVETEWEHEYDYQMNGEKDDEYLKEILSVLKRIYVARYGKGITQLVALDLIETKNKELDELKRAKEDK